MRDNSISTRPTGMTITHPILTRSNPGLHSIYTDLYSANDSRRTEMVGEHLIEAHPARDGATANVTVNVTMKRR